jgi:hypothetical protein
MASWSQVSACPSKRRVISRMTASTHWMRPALQSLASLGS